MSDTTPPPWVRNMPADVRTLTARWVFPASSPPFEDGTVTVRGDRIEAVEPRGVRSADEDLGNVALIPGLVNAHTHLDLSGARGLIPPTDPDHFTDWLKGVIAYRRTRSEEQTLADIEAGLAECLKFGTTLIGDIASEGKSWDALRAANTRAICFYELIGLSEERANAAMLRAREFVERVDQPHAVGVQSTRLAFSPHAPYSVHTSLFADTGRLCREAKRPLAVHLAESFAEQNLVYRRRGPFVPFLKELGAFDRDGLAVGFDRVMELCDFQQSKLFVHCNYLASFARFPPNSTIVYCPRTHAAFGHPPHPFRDFLARGVRMCLGTDSLASNPDLDILAEARFVHAKYPDFPVEQLLKMVTLSGAEALGWADECGSLEAGKSADVVAVPLADVEGDPHELLFADTPGERRTLWRGEWR
jgi:cytosine/adenosine deaminase-related metal-dependent hydrolase